MNVDEGYDEEVVIDNDYHRKYELGYRKHCFDKAVSIFRKTLEEFDNDQDLRTMRSDAQVLLGGALAHAINERGISAAINRRPISGRVRTSLFAEAELNGCSWCGSYDALEIDHVRPVSLGGGNELRNLQVLCRSCNRAKKNRFAG